MQLWIIAASINGFIAVAMGAFAAHGLKARVTPEALGWIETAARYEAVHALALLAVAILSERAVGAALHVAGWGFLTGTVLFCGSLYLMGLTGWRGLAIATPFGGLAFLIGWAGLLVYGLGSRFGSHGG
jgi:uncharacterized membrane protein YgdD (TMEM256/DUF423 family)